MEDRYGIVGQKKNSFLILEGILPSNNPSGRYSYKCQCDCGLIFVARYRYINKSITKDCGHSLGRNFPNGTSTVRAIYRSYCVKSKSRNLVMELSLDYFTKLLFNNCHYCGIEPSRERCEGSKRNKIKYNGIDRINSLEGYTISNCVTCCSNCNYAKSNMSYEEFFVWIKRMIIFKFDKVESIS